jgi:hypothetical protein
MSEEKKPRVLILREYSSRSMQEKINQLTEKGYRLEGSVQVITESIEVQRAGTLHKYNNIYLATMNSHGAKIKD